ncbi:MAG TPA: DUF5010 domain-containing protein [Verrucomicrobiota bacterium]|nr:DUF5010 domain-containing protein [Verrucomicrobiota bacterium]HNU50492.1 DUF5010 domain-containing protein [Verrucomicrobiota bacterium]
MACLVALGVSTLGLGWTLRAANPAPINPPLGPHVNLAPADFAGSSTFTAADRIVLTPYFYWYDVYTQAHIVNGDGSDALTDHPPTLAGFSYKSKAWHAGQLRDLAEAGIDVLLPVYWGEPSQRIPNQPASAHPWSYAGIPPLVQAREELLSAGERAPALGLFYDTSTLEYNNAGRRIDLTTDFGRQWFYETVRDFYSLVPPKHWAMIEGKPIVFLYAAGFAARHDQSCIDFLRASFARDFGGREPFVVREISWQVQTENVYAWGGALGLKNPGVASLGPGYDHSAVPGRQPLIVDREGGAFFERQWTRFLRKPSLLVMIETWNEYHEGTDVAASREYGRQYIELNRKYVDLFRRGIRPPRPQGPYTDVRSVSVRLQSTNVASGLEQIEHADGVTAPAEVGGSGCRTAVSTEHGGRYIYFRIDDSFKWADPMRVDVEVEYWDAASGSFRIEFDGSDTNAPFQGAYTATAQSVRLGGTPAWKTASFRLTGAHFGNAQNGGADFRLVVNADPFCVRQVRVIRLGIPAEIGSTVRGWQQDFAGVLGTNWIRLGGEPGGFTQAGGLLSVAGADAAGQVLLANLPGSASAIQEVLARVRVVSVAGSNTVLGGLTMAFDTNHVRGIDCRFRIAASGAPGFVMQGKGVSGESAFNFEWTTNRWYWLRVRHQTNALANASDVLARIWAADGETPEPSAWTGWWDYHPASPARAGLPGLAVGAGDQGVLEFDYFLVKAEGLPEVATRLPAFKPRRPQLAAVGFTPAEGFRARLDGEPDTGHLVEQTGDFVQWIETAVTTGAGGRVEYLDSQAAGAAHRFYRARPVP